MKVRVPEYFDRFICLANECGDTCCGGWRIDIDEKSYRAYRRVRGPFGRRLARGIDRRRRCFKLRDRYCEFFNDEGFCDIYKELGREGVCRACREYPRHREDYGRLQEWTLSLSCPEAARLILEDETQGAWKSIEKHENGHDRSHGEDTEAFRADLKALQELRQTMVCLIKDRSVSWNQRLSMVLALAHDAQRDWSRIGLLSERYLSPEAASRFAERLKPFQNRDMERMVRTTAWMRVGESLEPVLRDWENWQEKIRRELYHRQPIADYRLLEQRFGQEALALEQEWENLALYFLHTYLLGAVYDGDLYSKVKLMIYSVRIIREWCLYDFLKTGSFDRETLVKAAYRYSREVENSDRNLAELEWRFSADPLFELPAMLTVLADRDQAGGKAARKAVSFT